jgi:hypothetical protein
MLLLPLLQAQASGKGGHKAVPGERRIRREIVYLTGAAWLLTGLCVSGFTVQGQVEFRF